MSCEHAYPGSCPTCTERELCGVYARLAAAESKLAVAEDLLRRAVKFTGDTDLTDEIDEALARIRGEKKEPAT